jgi:hypothetical protein
VKDRGVAVLAIFGNVITAWSWFGTNQLSIGLHAYGFDSRLADGCFNFWVSQLLILGLGLIPQRFWSGAFRRSTMAIPVAPAPISTDTPALAPPPKAPPTNGAPNGQKPHSNGQSRKDKRKNKRK